MWRHISQRKGGSGSFVCMRRGEKKRQKKKKKKGRVCVCEKRGGRGWRRGGAQRGPYHAVGEQFP